MYKFNENIEKEYLVISKNPSTGCQQKYYKDGYWYKIDNFGGEAISEELATKVLDYSGIELNKYVKYERGLVNGSNACRSKNCLSKEQALYSLEKIYQQDLQNSLTTHIKQYKTGKERYDFVTDYFYEKHGVDIAGELEAIFFLDKIILNEDRHLNNIFLIYENGIFKPAPILDNGTSLFVGNDSVKKQTSNHRKHKKDQCKTFFYFI